MEIIQIVGYKNSGKTTLATKVIEALVHQGLRVASLKHHGHGGIPEGLKDTDSEKHRKAGAIIAGVEGDGVLQFSQHQSWSLEQMIKLYEMMNIDVLVIEGFKRYGFKKIVLINKEEDLSLLNQVTNVKAVISSLLLSVEATSCPVFQRTEVKKFVDWLLHVQLKKET